MKTPKPTDDAIIARTRAWVEGVVMRFNFCPFAAPVVKKDQVRYAVSHARNARSVVPDLRREVRRLLETDPEALATTLLITPDTLQEFLDFNDFLDRAERVIDAEDPDEHLQLATFHPGYYFADSDPAAITNYTNRAPYPILHLLRRDQVTWAIAHHPDTTRIPGDNMARLNNLEPDEREDLLRLSTPDAD